MNQYNNLVKKKSIWLYIFIFFDLFITFYTVFFIFDLILITYQLKNNLFYIISCFTCLILILIVMLLRKKRIAGKIIQFLYGIAFSYFIYIFLQKIFLSTLYIDYFLSEYPVLNQTIIAIIIFISIILHYFATKDFYGINKKYNNNFDYTYKSPDINNSENSDIMKLLNYNDELIDTHVITESVQVEKIKNPPNVEAYEKSHILTEREYSFLMNKLLPLVKKYNLYVLSKIKIADIVKVRKEFIHDVSHLNRIQQKHIDFVLVDCHYYIQFLIELDDCTHDNLKTIERDKFVDSLYSHIGYKLIRLRDFNDDIIERELQAKYSANINIITNI